MIKSAAFHRASRLPPAVQSVALVGANDESPVARFAASLGAFELRPNFIARGGGGPGVGGRGARVEEREKGGDGNEKCFHLEYHYRGKSRNAIKSAICSMVMEFSRPSGMSETPEPEMWAMSWRSTVSVAPSARFRVTLELVSSEMMPSMARPSLVSMV